MHGGVGVVVEDLAEAGLGQDLDSWSEEGKGLLFLVSYTHGRGQGFRLEAAIIINFDSFFSCT